MTLTEAQTQFNALADRLSAAKAAQKAALAALGRTPTDVWDTYPDELRAVTGGTGNYQESKTVTADPAGMTILPDEGYSGMLKAIIAAEPNFQPWNLVDGIEAWGITGTAKPAVSTAPPTNLPVDKDDADTAYEDATGAAPTEADYFILADNDGNITYGYMQSASTALYNGVELPDINAVRTNKETYPYAYMYYFSSSDLRLLLTNKAIISVDASTNVGIRFPASTTYLIYKSAPVGSAWSYVNKVTTSSSNLTAAVNTDDFLWCNESIVSTDGVVVFAASDPIPVGGGFTITYYDHSTTEFKATGWTRLSYHTTGDSAGTWTLDDFTSAESGGWNYLKNIRSCTRDKLYYKGYEVWPDDSEYRASLGGGTMLYNGVELPDIKTVWTDKETYPYAVIVLIEGVTVVHFTSAVTYSNSNFWACPVGTAYTLYVLENNSWRFAYEGVAAVEISGTPTSAIIWTSHDILNTDGTVYLAASEPVKP